MRAIVWITVLLLTVGGLAYGGQKLSSYLAARSKVEYLTEAADRGDLESVVRSTGEVKPVLSVSVGSFVDGPVIALHADFNDPVTEGQLLAEIDPRIYEAAVSSGRASVASSRANLTSGLAEVTSSRAALVSAEAEVAAQKAGIATNDATIGSAQATLQMARNDERRAMNLRRESEDYISQAEIDGFRFGRESREADLKSAKAGKLRSEAGLKQAEASLLQAKASLEKAVAGVDRAKADVQRAEADLENSEARLNYTKIVSPVDGIIIDRKIDPGQTLAAQFQTPELFVIAPQMREEMHIFASVDEADIGELREAQQEQRPVRFTVYAYPDEKFIGTIDQIRFSPVAEQSVVTYPVVVSTPNPDLKLMPGMTADLEFVVETREDIVRVPNAALRFFPAADQVRPEDKWLITGKKDKEGAESGSAVAESGSTAESGSIAWDDDLPPVDVPPLGEPVADDETDSESGTDEESEKDDTRHVWVIDGAKLRAIPVTTGISDGKFTEVLTGDVKPGTKLVTGVK